MQIPLRLTAVGMLAVMVNISLADPIQVKYKASSKQHQSNDAGINPAYNKSKVSINIERQLKRKARKTLWHYKKEGDLKTG